MTILNQFFYDYHRIFGKRSIYKFHTVHISEQMWKEMLSLQQKKMCTHINVDSSHRKCTSEVKYSFSEQIFFVLLLPFAIIIWSEWKISASICVVRWKWICVVSFLLHLFAWQNAHPYHIYVAYFRMWSAPHTKLCQVDKRTNVSIRIS